MHNSYIYHFWGMHFIWWVIWGILLVWIFFIPYNIPGQKTKKDKPIDILNKRFALGEIELEEYREKLSMLKKNEIM